MQFSRFLSAHDAEFLIGFFLGNVFAENKFTDVDGAGRFEIIV